MKYKDWMYEWLEIHVRVTDKERTYLKYRQQAEKYILPVLGEVAVDALTPSKLQHFSAALKERGIAASTANGIICILKLSLKRAVTMGIADRQYSDTVARPRIRERPVGCFSMTEQRKMERYILASKKPKLFGILLTLYTGLRLGELLALRWEDVDLKEGRIAVTHSCHDSWEDGRYRKVFDTPKTPSSERVIPIPRQLVSKLRALKERTRGAFLVAGRTEYGAEIRCYQRTFCNVLRDLGLPHRGFHALRHTFATRALEVGMDVKTLAEILGHSNASMTLRRYAHSLLEHKREMMNKVGRLLG